MWVPQINRSILATKNASALFSRTLIHVLDQLILLKELAISSTGLPRFYMQPSRQQTTLELSQFARVRNLRLSPEFLSWWSEKHLKNQTVIVLNSTLMIWCRRLQMLLVLVLQLSGRVSSMWASKEANCFQKNCLQRDRNLAFRLTIDDKVSEVKISSK